jgi:phosphoenolpyruvate carboxykinase (GTP)
MGSETTAAMVGGNGSVRRDPFAMLPFCGYHMSDYFAHWLALGQRLAASGATLPRVYCVNWFRKGADGKFVWPGYGENMRVLAWMMGRVEGGAGGGGGGQDHVFGISPRFADLHWDGLDFTVEQFDSVIGVDHGAWREEVTLHAEWFGQLADRLPPALDATRERLQQRLAR